MVTAQANYRRMLKDEVAPALRALGLTGSGSAYVVPDQEYWALVGLQGSRSNDARRVRFTVNFVVVPKDVWARAQAAFPSMLGARPAPNVVPSLLAVDDYGRAWWERIGRLLPGRPDRWWEVRPERGTSDVSREVVEAIRDYGLPAIRDRISSGL